MKVEEYLRRNGLLEGLTMHDIDSITKKFERVLLQKEEVLFEEGSNSKDIYILASGELRIFKSREAEVYEITTQTEVGALIGEIAYLCDLKRTSSVAAVDSAVLYKLAEGEIGTEPQWQIFMKNVATKGLEKVVVSDSSYMSSIKKTMELLEDRAASGLFFITTIIGFSLSVICVGIIELKNYSLHTSLSIWVQLLVLVAPPLFYVLKYRVPLSEIGIHTRNLKTSLIRGLMISAVYALLFIFVLYLTKPALLKEITLDKFLNLGGLSYFFHSILQEILARGIMQTTMKKILGDERGYLAIFVSAVIFSIYHSPLGLFMVVATFVGGLFFGYLYHKDDSLVGVSIVHYVFGAFIFAVL